MKRPAQNPDRALSDEKFEDSLQTGKPVMTLRPPYTAIPVPATVCVLPA